MIDEKMLKLATAQKPGFKKTLMDFFPDFERIVFGGGCSSCSKKGLENFLEMLSEEQQKWVQETTTRIYEESLRGKTPIIVKFFPMEKQDDEVFEFPGIKKRNDMELKRPSKKILTRTFNLKKEALAFLEKESEHYLTATIQASFGKFSVILQGEALKGSAPTKSLGSQLLLAMREKEFRSWFVSVLPEKEKQYKEIKTTCQANGWALRVLAEYQTEIQEKLKGSLFEGNPFSNLEKCKD